MDACALLQAVSYLRGLLPVADDTGIIANSSGVSQCESIECGASSKQNEHRSTCQEERWANGLIQQRGRGSTHREGHVSRRRSERGIHQVHFGFVIKKEFFATVSKKTGEIRLLGAWIYDE